MQSAPWQTTTPATPDAGSAEPGTSTATVLLQPIAVHAVGPMPAHPVVTSTSTADAVATPVVPRRMPPWSPTDHERAVTIRPRSPAVEGGRQQGSVVAGSAARHRLGVTSATAAARMAA
ncbi:hypothetical protein [Curtobacterium oceanosedimentum]|uniref:hypothetical protein n=1 Tax=Curtobacterium oceanosedimentum TaxID=465820 RepID=UPI0033995D2D